MKTATTKETTQAGTGRRGQHHAAFAIILGAFVGLYVKVFVALVNLCLHGESYSHILLIPFIAAFLIYSERKSIFRSLGFAIAPGIAAIVPGLVISLVANAHFYSTGDRNISGAIFGFVLVAVGCFVACYGLIAARHAVFPLIFLLLMVPLPSSILNRVVAALQHGSVWVTVLIFKVAGVPVLQRGVVLSVPGVTIEVAQECSSIRSSMALLVTCILAARFYLRSFWKQTFFVLLSIPLSVIKNGIRIATLTLLSIYVNPGFLHGDLHRDGGFVFFLIALALLWPVLVALHRSESTLVLRAHEMSPRNEPIRG